MSRRGLTLAERDFVYMVTVAHGVNFAAAAKTLSRVATFPISTYQVYSTFDALHRTVRGDKLLQETEERLTDELFALMLKAVAQASKPEVIEEAKFKDLTAGVGILADKLIALKRLMPENVVAPKQISIKSEVARVHEQLQNLGREFIDATISSRDAVPIGPTSDPQGRSDAYDGNGWPVESLNKES